MASLRICLLHYWLIAHRGGERVLKELAELARPQVCYTHLADPGIVTALQLPCPVRQSVFARIPLARRGYKLLFPLMYCAAWLLPTRGADLIVSSESGPIKGVRKGKAALHVCYCHSPFRILWAPAEWYQPALGGYWRLLSLLRRPLRWIDRLTARSVDVFVTNSSFIRQRIREAYGRDAVVIHPPVDVARFIPSTDREDYFVWLGELVSYKRPDLVVEAFRLNGLPLKVIGRGEMLSKLRKASPPNIEYLTDVSDAELPALLARSRALVFCGVEDFGIAFVEALASGTPVIAADHGGVRDIVSDGETGVLFQPATSAELNAALRRFSVIEASFDPAVLARSARRFAPEIFRARFAALLESELRARGLDHG